MMAVWIVPIVVFMVSTGAVIGLYMMATRLPEFFRRRRLASRLAEVSQPVEHRSVDNAPSELIKRRIEGPLPGLDRLIGQTGRGSRFGRWLEQTGLKISPSGVVVIAVSAGALAWIVTAAISHQPWASVSGAVLAAAAPFAVLRHRRAARLRRFEEHFPEALDLIARAVRAGHGFVSGLKMVADELEDPVGPEFRKTFDEQNFGLSMKDALTNFSERIPLLDVRFFATAVLIQRDTGGNLSEILDNLAHVVRERFKILRQVRVHTAHGRFTGWVLMALPVGLAIALSFINPEHMGLLFHEPMGQAMMIGAIIMQTIGFLWIKCVVKIEV